MHWLLVAALFGITVPNGLIAVYLARHPIGPVRWPTFVTLSIIGGLGFSLPFYYWLNVRAAERARA